MTSPQSPTDLPLDRDDLDPATFADAQAAIAASVFQIADALQGDTLKLLELLRFLEDLHRQVRDGYFQQSLPNNRQALYALLRDIELDGGWPQIRRVQLDYMLMELNQRLDSNLPHPPSEPEASS